MDKANAQNLIKNTFNFPFNENSFVKFSKNLIDDLTLNSNTSWFPNTNLPSSIKDRINSYKSIGYYKYSNNEQIAVLAVELDSEQTVNKSRFLQRIFAQWYLEKNNFDAVLVSFFSKRSQDWRFSLIKIEYRREINIKGDLKILKKISPLQRYSYLVGENEPNHTAQAQLSPLLFDNSINPSIDTLIQSFSVENVSKQFFKRYRDLCFDLVEEIERIRKSDDSVNFTFKENNIDNLEFSKKLLGQIVFLYFIQKKGWLGVKRKVGGKYDKWGGGPKDFMRKLFNKEYCEYKNFFNDVLEPLFYIGLSIENPESYYPKLDCKIPFLNGGLFEPIKNYNWSETDIVINDKLFKEILDTFDQYNFTVNEDDPLDRDVAIDPEMLGKIFESLLPENLRSRGGVFYTPTEVVNSMCKNSLIYFLNNNFGNFIKLSDITTFIYNLDDIYQKDFSVIHSNNNNKKEYLTPFKIIEHSKDLLNLIKKIKICDPAIGSGAFPLSMVSELVKINRVLNLHIGINPNLYSVKSNIIQNSIYGVDIDSGALEITKLRLWLSLVVDQNSLNEINPLPNLDFKIVQGNSLFEKYNGIKLFNENYLLNFDSDKQLGLEFFETDDLSDKLYEMTQNFFDETNRIKKQKIKEEVSNLQWDLIKKTLESEKKFNQLKELQSIENKGNDKFFLWKLNFSDVFNNGGFDIIIGNPPYGFKFNDIDKKELKSEYPEVPDYESSCYFEKKSINLLKSKGIKCFIVPNTFLINLNAKKYRSSLLSDWKILKIINISKLQIFEDAGVRNCITFFEKNNSNLTSDINFVEMLENNQIINDKYFNTQSLHENIDNWLTLFSQNEVIAKLLKKINSNCQPLSNFCDVSQGLIPYDKYRGHSKETIKNKIWHADHKKDKTFKKELKGKDISKYSLSWNRKLWISYGNWLAAPRKKDFFNKPRILVREVTNPHILATYEENEYYNRPSIINLINFRNISPYVLLSIINSSLFSFYHFENSPKSKKGMFPKILVDDIRKLPIKINIDKKIQKTLEKKAIEALKGDDKIKSEAIDEIDQIIFDLYEIKKTEINKVKERILST